MSSLGAWFDWRQTWEFPASIADYQHQAFKGRDGRVRVVYPGFLFPFGHRCHLVKITEHEVKQREAPVAYLWQRHFIIVREPTRDYSPDERDNPFGSVTLSPLVTPDIDPPPEQSGPFVPNRHRQPFAFTLTTVEWTGAGVCAWPVPLLLVQVVSDGPQIVVVGGHRASDRYSSVRHIHGPGQTLAVAHPLRAGDTDIAVAHLIFDGQIDEAAATSRPFMVEARDAVPAMRHLAPRAPAVDLVYARSYLSLGLPGRPPDASPVPGTPNAR